MPRRRQPARDTVLELFPDHPGGAAARPAPPASIEVDARSADAALLTASATLERAAADQEDPWASSPFRWIKSLPAPRRGKVGIEMVELLLRGVGHVVSPRTGPGHDLVVEGTKTQVRFSTLWSSGWYTFQKIRDVGDYEVLVLFGLSPTRGHGWLVDRNAAVTAAAGAAGWLTVDPANPPGVLTGGSIDRLLVAAASRFGAPGGEPHGPARRVMGN